MPLKRKKPSGPNNSYLLSFGDTMTTLLAFFIVLNSLSEDQTGANLHAGTGSFVRAVSSAGMQSHFIEARGKQAVKMQQPNALYMVESESDEEKGSKGPDDNDDAVRIIDRQREDFERFMKELGRLAEMKEEPNVRGETVFDYFTPLGKGDTILTDSYRSALSQIIPLLHQPDYRIEIIVWATTPSDSAWTRAAEQSHKIGAEISILGRLNAKQKMQIQTTAKPWFDEKAKRPVVSFVTRRI